MAERYRLVDPRRLAEEASYTFFLPGEEEIAAVREGDMVKLIFELVPPGEQWTAERMWVTVTRAGRDALEGRLENTPAEAAMVPGETVAFERHHIIAVEWRDPAPAPPPPVRREYWERCMVDSCVLFDGVPVEYLYRGEPDLDEEGDRFPDSGWRIRGRRGGASDEEMDARDGEYVALGAVLNRDDSWLHLIDAPVGSGFLRDFDAGTYRSCRDP